MVSRKYFISSPLLRRLNSSMAHRGHVDPYLGFPMSLPQDFKYKVDKAYYDCTASLQKYDKSSELLLHYIPEPARKAFAAVKCFNLEMSKINTGGQTGQSFSRNVGFHAIDLKFKFWEDMLYKLNTREVIGGGEPMMLLLQDSILQELAVDTSYLQTFIDNRKAYLVNPVFRTADDICSYGEGTYSQLNYFVQSLLLSPDISPSAVSLIEHSSKIQSLMTDIAAHIGQANAIATMIAGVNYYAKKEQITLPLDTIAKSQISEEQILRLCQGYVEPGSKELDEITNAMKDIVFDTSIKANDHVLAAKAKFRELHDEMVSVTNTTEDELLLRQSNNWLGHVPDAIFVPFMSIIPVELYLSKLEANDFDVFSKNLSVRDWKLAWTSYRCYNKRSL